jgi:hypothetical protein
MVFVGTKGAPDTHCGNTNGSIPATTIDETPLISEKPYIVKDDDGKFKLMVPILERRKVGTTPNFSHSDEIDFSRIYVASANDSAETINAIISDPDMHLVLQPGIYNLTDSIKINNPDTVVFGMGLVTLVATNGTPCIEVGKVNGVRISGILFQAGEQNSETLLKWGDGTPFDGFSDSPGIMHDVFARVGGADENEVKATSMISISNGNVIIDDTWLWRADHDLKGPVVNGTNPVDTALLVNGDNVIGYGLACEHTLGNLLEWNGENG